MKIDVVICSHNRPVEIEMILVALNRQTLRPNIIVVDDSDQFNYPAPLGMIFMEQHLSCLVRPGGCLDGFYHRVLKFNLGVERSFSDHFILLDDDCVPQSEFFCQVYAEMLENFGVVRGLFVTPTEVKLTPWFSTTNIGFTRKIWDAIGGFDMRYDGRYGYEDLDLEQSIKHHGLESSIVTGTPGTRVEHIGIPFSGDRVATQINERLYREKWGL